MDPPSPPRSRSKRQATEAEEQPRKKVRGRPLKSSHNSNVPEERRAQIRRAQEAFRLRKLAATKSLEDKIKSLEACVQDMSTIFVDLSDSMIQSNVLQKDPAIAQNLVAATSKFITLAKSAVDESDDTADEKSEQVSATPRREVTLSQQHVPSRTSSGPLSNRKSTPMVSAPRLPIPEDFNPVPETLMKKEVFGNGWFGLQPEMFNHLSQPTNNDMTRLDSSFGMRLLQITLSIAYDYLMETSGPRYDAEINMYQFALLYHTRQELLFNLRWFLGPGIRALRALGRAVFGFNSSLSLQYLNATSSGMEPRILNPLVDALALAEAHNKNPTIQYLNAFDVEDYIISKGAFHIDNEIIRMKILDDDRLNPGWLGVKTSSNVVDLAAAAGDISGRVPRATEDFTSVSNSSTLSNFCSEFDPLTAMLNDQLLDESWSGMFNLEEENHNPTSNTAFPTQIPLVPNRVRTLSVPMLLQSLAKRAQCLGTGPGYPSRTVDLAIELSTVDYSPY